MNDIVIKTERTEMKFPLPLITPQMIVDAIGNEDTIRFMDAIPAMEYTQKEAESFIAFLETTKDSATELELGIFNSDTNCFMGMCTLENISREYSVCEIGYWLSKPYTGKGYMTECVRSLVQYAQEELGISRINAFVIKEHERSIALLERLGFRRRELLKKDTENKGKAVDRIWYQLTM